MFTYKNFFSAPPRLSINLLPEENSVECKVTENLKPELQLCIRTAGDWNCKVIVDIFLLISFTERKK